MSKKTSAGRILLAILMIPVGVLSFLTGIGLALHHGRKQSERWMETILLPILLLTGPVLIIAGLVWLVFLLVKTRR